MAATPRGELAAALRARLREAEAEGAVFEAPPASSIANFVCHVKQSTPRGNHQISQTAKPFSKSTPIQSAADVSLSSIPETPCSNRLVQIETIPENNVVREDSTDDSASDVSDADSLNCTRMASLVESRDTKSTRPGNMFKLELSGISGCNQEGERTHESPRQFLTDMHKGITPRGVETSPTRSSPYTTTFNSNQDTARSCTSTAASPAATVPQAGDAHKKGCSDDEELPLEETANVLKSNPNTGFETVLNADLDEVKDADLEKKRQEQSINDIVSLTRHLLDEYTVVEDACKANAEMVKVLSKQVKDLKQENYQVKNDLDRLKDEHEEDIQARIADQEMTVKLLEDQISDLQERNKQSAVQPDSKRVKFCSHCEGYGERLRAERQQLYEENKSLLADNNRLRAEVAAHCNIADMNDQVMVHKLELTQSKVSQLELTQSKITQLDMSQSTVRSLDLTHSKTSQLELSHRSDLSQSKLDQTIEQAMDRTFSSLSSRSGEGDDLLSKDLLHLEEQRRAAGKVSDMMTASLIRYTEEVEQTLSCFLAKAYTPLHVSRRACIELKNQFMQGDTPSPKRKARKEPPLYDVKSVTALCGLKNTLDVIVYISKVLEGYTPLSALPQRESEKKLGLAQVRRVSDLSESEIRFAPRLSEPSDSPLAASLQREAGKRLATVRRVSDLSECDIQFAPRLSEQGDSELRFFPQGGEPSESEVRFAPRGSEIRFAPRGSV